jgi:hypothetical protein
VFARRELTGSRRQVGAGIKTGKRENRQGAHSMLSMARPSDMGFRMGIVRAALRTVRDAAENTHPKNIYIALHNE